jgi:hypothetical protein
MKAIKVSKRPAAAEAGEAAPTLPALPQSQTVPAKRRRGELLQYLDADGQKSVEDLRPSYNAYKGLQRYPGVREKRLAEDQDGSRHGLYTIIFEAYKEYIRLWSCANNVRIARRKEEQGAVKEQAHGEES